MHLISSAVYYLCSEKTKMLINLYSSAADLCLCFAYKQKADFLMTLFFSHVFINVYKNACIFFENQLFACVNVGLLKPGCKMYMYIIKCFESNIWAASQKTCFLHMQDCFTGKADKPPLFFCCQEIKISLVSNSKISPIKLASVVPLTGF